MLVSNYFNFFSLGLVIILSACAQKNVVTVPEQTPLGQMAKSVCSYLATEDFKYTELFDSTFQTALPEAKFKTLLKQFAAEQGKCLRVEKITPGNPNEVFYRTDKDRLVKVLLATDSAQKVVNGLWLKGEVVANQEAQLMARQWCAYRFH